jgi:hypothetical protein
LTRVHSAIVFVFALAHLLRRDAPAAHPVTTGKREPSRRVVLRTACNLPRARFDRALLGTPELHRERQASLAGW